MCFKEKVIYISKLVILLLSSLFITMDTPEACKQGRLSNILVILAYLSLPSEKLPSIPESLRINDLKHRRNRFFGTDYAFNFPANRYIGHIPKVLLIDLAIIVIAVHSRGNFTRMHRQD